MFIGFLIGAIVGLGRSVKNPLLYGAATIYVEVIRGTPIMVQALYIYFALPLMLGIKIDPIIAGIMSIAINAGAYIAEIVRGSIQSIDPGQVEAGRSLGLTSAQTFYNVVWPQAFRRMIPPLGNQFIISLKDTSLLTVIGVGELTRQKKGCRSIDPENGQRRRQIVQGGSSAVAFPARALDNTVYILGVNTVGEGSCGKSKLLSPAGEVLCAAPRELEWVLLHEVDPSVTYLAEYDARLTPGGRATGQPERRLALFSEPSFVNPHHDQHGYPQQGGRPSMIFRFF
ncbi:ABC transporter permease subunit [Brevibacillus massiliensis]|uniref:ABC transporter permease subunit n=1 Tax=Brevibacillus massiliensis TaxID=1118054 RepID=UPI0002F9603D|nr:ABC transporter permease subunit [Brevibacillus massiliensis]